MKNKNKKEVGRLINKTNYKFKILVQWLSQEYLIENAKRQLEEAEILEMGGEITITYSNGVKDIVKINKGSVVQIY